MHEKDLNIIGAGLSNIMIPPIIDSLCACPPTTVSLHESLTSAVSHSPLCPQEIFATARVGRDEVSFHQLESGELREKAREFLRVEHLAIVHFMDWRHLVYILLRNSHSQLEGRFYNMLTRHTHSSLPLSSEFNTEGGFYSLFSGEIEPGFMDYSSAWKPSFLMPKRYSERQEMPPVGSFRCLELCLYGIRELA